MSDNHCGCPHPQEEHGCCAVGEFCAHEDCRCVDGHYYGRMSETVSPLAPITTFKSIRTPTGMITVRVTAQIQKRLIEQPTVDPNKTWWASIRFAKDIAPIIRSYAESVRAAVLEQIVQIYEHAFRDNWVVEDCIQEIRALLKERNPEHGKD